MFNGVFISDINFTADFIWKSNNKPNDYSTNEKIYQKSF